MARPTRCYGPPSSSWGVSEPMFGMKKCFFFFLGCRSEAWDKAVLPILGLFSGEKHTYIIFSGGEGQEESLILFIRFLHQYTTCVLCLQGNQHIEANTTLSCLEMGAYILTCLLLLPRFFWELGWIHTFFLPLIFLLPESLGGQKNMLAKPPRALIISA